jgi:hypothetical protein
MSDPGIALGAWWSLARANTTALGVVVAVVAIAAVAFVARRVLSRRRG